MLSWGELSYFEIGVTILLIAIWGLGLVLYNKLSYLVRLKEIELRKIKLIEPNDY